MYFIGQSVNRAKSYVEYFFIAQNQPNTVLNILNILFFALLCFDTLNVAHYLNLYWCESWCEPC